MSYKHVRSSGLRLTITPMIGALSLLYQVTKNRYFPEIKDFVWNVLICNLQSYQ